jgi:hypothetical protein
MKEATLSFCIMCLAALTAIQGCHGGSMSAMTPFSITLDIPQGLVLNDGKSIHLEKQTINAVTQDESWYALHDIDKNNATDDERISTHLNYVRDMLEKKDTKHLSKEASANRKHMLNLLNNYTLNSMFPTNVDELFESRTPIFIDQLGVSCAVGHLILNSENEKYVDGMVTLNEKFPTAYLMDVFNGDYGEEAKNLILAWAKEHGFEPVELAMIQPTYKWMRPPPRRPKTRQPGFNLRDEMDEFDQYVPKPMPQYDICVNTKMKKILCPSKKRGCKHAGRGVYVCKKPLMRPYIQNRI